MTITLIIFSDILVASVIAHYLFWRDSKRRYAEYMKRSDALRKKMEQLEESNIEMDRMLDEADGKMEKIDEGIEDLRSGMFMRIKKPTFDN